MSGFNFKTFVLLSLVASTGAAFGFAEIPRDSAKALKATRGKPIDTGIVFINGKFIPPPYVVERWGTGIRINSKPVTGQVIDWSEFLKTQEGVKVTKTTDDTRVITSSGSAPAVTSATPAANNSSTTKAAEEDAESSLDDLFDDDPKPKAKKKTPAVSRPAPKPRTTVSYSMSGDFVPNDASKALVARINKKRTEIDLMLRNGGFICFGEAYSQVTGDSRTARQLLEKLPELMKDCETSAALRSSLRSAGLYYVNDLLADELFRNRVDYRKLQEWRQKAKKQQEWNNLINGSSAL